MATSDSQSTEDVPVVVGADHLQHLEAVAEAASDLRLAYSNDEFAVLNGGYDELERVLFAKVSAWESFASEYLDEELP